MFSKQALRRLILPLIIEQFLAVMVGMADIMMVSSAGEAAVSSVALVDLINVLIINIFAALATGGAVVCAQSIGAQTWSGPTGQPTNFCISSPPLPWGSWFWCFSARQGCWACCSAKWSRR